MAYSSPCHYCQFALIGSSSGTYAGSYPPDGRCLCLPAVASEHTDWVILSSILRAAKQTAAGRSEGGGGNTRLVLLKFAVWICQTAHASASWWVLDSRTQTWSRQRCPVAWHRTASCVGRLLLFSINSERAIPRLERGLNLPAPSSAVCLIFTPQPPHRAAPPRHGLRLGSSPLITAAATAVGRCDTVSIMSRRARASSGTPMRPTAPSALHTWCAQCGRHH